MHRRRPSIKSDKSSPQIRKSVQINLSYLCLQKRNMYSGPGRSNVLKLKNTPANKREGKQNIMKAE